MTDPSIIKELDRLIIMGSLVSRNATRLKKKIEGGVSTPPKDFVALDGDHMKLIADRRKNRVKSKVK